MRMMSSEHSWVGYGIPAAIILAVIGLRWCLGRGIGRPKSGSWWMVPGTFLGLITYMFVHSHSLKWDMFAIPVAQAPLWLFQALALIFVFLIIRAAMRRKDESGARQDMASRVGIAIQGIAFIVVGLGPVKATLPVFSVPALAAFAAVLLLMIGVLALFAASSSALGKNWSIKARTLNDHELIRSGPYSYVRHPIYLAMLLFLLAMVIALGHWICLIAALPIFLVGTMMRINAEDRLLEASFGEQFIKYRNSTPALLPRIR